jgi:hypothetical protein
LDKRGGLIAEKRQWFCANASMRFRRRSYLDFDVFVLLTGLLS